MPLKSAAARPFPESLCFSLMNLAGQAVLSLAARSEQERNVFVASLSTQVHCHGPRRFQLTKLVQTVLRVQYATVAKRVAQLNAQYAAAGRGEQVKWFFQETNTTTAKSCCDADDCLVKSNSSSSSQQHPRQPVDRCIHSSARSSMSEVWMVLDESDSAQ